MQSVQPEELGVIELTASCAAHSNALAGEISYMTGDMILRRDVCVSRNGAIGMVRIRKPAVRPPLRLVLLSLVPIGLGILKILLHYHSRFRLEPLDYVIAVGAILGGVFLFAQKPSRVILLISGSFIVVELFKAIVDRRDLFDVFFTIIAIVYLSVPFLRYRLERARA